MLINFLLGGTESGIPKNYKALVSIVERENSVSVLTHEQAEKIGSVLRVENELEMMEEKDLSGQEEKSHKLFDFFFLLMLNHSYITRSNLLIVLLLAFIKILHSTEGKFASRDIPVFEFLP